MSRRSNAVAAAMFLAPSVFAVVLLRLWPAALSFRESLLVPGVEG